MGGGGISELHVLLICIVSIANSFHKMSKVVFFHLGEQKT